MAKVIAAKDILTKLDFTKPIEDQLDGKSKRHASHEFQAYAYRLAHDLNDLVNLKIYMRLAKNVDRAILERVYSYVIDSNVDQKGPLFLWKLKKLRNELKQTSQMKNYDYDFVIKKMKILRNSLAKEIIRKYDMNDASEVIGWIKTSAMVETTSSDSWKILRALIIGNISEQLPESLNLLNYHVTGIDPSNKLTSLLKDRFVKQKALKFITKDFLQNTFKDSFFDIVIVTKYWQIVPIEKEKDYVLEIQRVLKPNGKFFIQGLRKDEKSQEWKVFTLNGGGNTIFREKNSLLFTLKNMEHEVWTVITKDEYDWIVKSLGEKIGSPMKSRRIAFRFGFNNAHNINTRIRITDGVTTITQKVHRYGESTTSGVEEIEQKVSNDPKEILKTLNFFRNILKDANGSHFFLIQFENLLWETNDFEIKLTHQTGNEEIFSFEIELKGNIPDNPEQKLRNIANEYGLNADFTLKDDQFWTEYNKRVNIDILDWDDESILKIIEESLKSKFFKQNR